MLRLYKLTTDVISTDRPCKNSAMVRRAYHERFRGCYKFKYLAVHPERRRRINDTIHTVCRREKSLFEPCIRQTVRKV